MREISLGQEPKPRAVSMWTYVPGSLGMLLDPDIMTGGLSFNTETGEETWTHMRWALGLCKAAGSVKVGLDQLNPPVQEEGKEAGLQADTPGTQAKSSKGTVLPPRPEGISIFKKIPVENFQLKKKQKNKRKRKWSTMNETQYRSQQSEHPPNISKNNR